MSTFSKERLKDLATLCAAGAIIALTAAIVISPPQSIPLVQEVAESSLTAAAACSGGSCTDTVGPLSIRANPNSVVTGSASTISWDATTAPDIPGDMQCLGNLSGTCGSNPTAYQSVGASSPNVTRHETFTYNNVLYATVLYNSSSNTGLRTYRWTATGTSCPAEGGWGNGTACGTALQTMASAYASSFDVHLINGHPYLQRTSITQKWTPSCSGWGDGTTCGATTYYAAISYTSSGGQIENIERSNIFESGGNYFVAMPRLNNSIAMYKWQMTGTGCPAGGSWGNGTACNTTPWMTGFGGDPYGPVQKFTVGGVDYILFDDESNATTRLYRWTASGTNCPTGGGWGNGTSACRTPVQSFRSNTAIALLTGGLYSRIIEGASPYPYLVIGASDGSSQTVQSRLYKWHPAGTSGCPAGGGFGNATTCGDSSVRSLGTNTGEPGVFVVGSKAYVGYNGQIRQLMPSSNCLGNGTACDSVFQTVAIEIPHLFTNNNKMYVLGLSGANSVTYKVIAQTAGGPSCSVVWSTDNFATSNPFSTNVSSAGLTTGPLSANRSYRLSCVGVTETVTVPVTVTNAPTVTLQVTEPFGIENPQNAGSFTVTRTSLGGATPYPALSVQATLTGTATNGSDYNIVLPITVSSGQSSVPLSVVPTADNVVENEETIMLTLTANPAYVLGATVSGTVRIISPPALDLNATTGTGGLPRLEWTIDNL